MNGVNYVDCQECVNANMKQNLHVLCLLFIEYELKKNLTIEFEALKGIFN